jgi:hypothetical protein
VGYGHFQEKNRNSVGTKLMKETKTAIKTEPAIGHRGTFADDIIRPDSQAAFTLSGLHGGNPGMVELIGALKLQVDKVNAGNMERPEAMLLMQAHTLDGLFNNLATKARQQESMKNYETFFRLALKAQGQCRATLETLSNIKNPPVIYAKQANISNGHQQINNGTPAPQAEEIKNQQNGLLGHTHGERLDRRAAGAASGKDKAMATVE